MDNNTKELLEKLATKLGTTVENLWNVLVFQAKVHAWVGIFQVIVITIGAYLFYRLHKRLANSDSECGYDQFGALNIPPMIIGSIIFALLLIMAFFKIGGIVTAFVNPQYWAIEQILSYMYL